MQIKELLTPERVLRCKESLSRKRALEYISELICQDLPNTDYLELFEAFVAREKLGSTGLGHGVAIPHVRTDATKTPIAVLLQLEEPIEFDSPDAQKVDLIFALAVPEEENEQHLQILASLAKSLSSNKFRQSLRHAADDTELFNTAIHCELH